MDDPGRSQAQGLGHGSFLRSAVLVFEAYPGIGGDIEELKTRIGRGRDGQAVRSGRLGIRVQGSSASQ